MQVTVTWPVLTGALTVLGTLAKVVHWLVGRELEKRDDKLRELEGAFKASRETQKILFDKLDHHHTELQNYKLEVAEKYVNESKLEKLIAPVLQRLDRIEDTLLGKARV